MVDFNKLRFDRTHHLGLGDVRLTIGQQQEIDAEIAALRLLYDGATVRSEVQAEKIAALRARVEALEAGLVEIQHRASCGEDCQVLADLADDLLEQKP